MQFILNLENGKQIDMSSYIMKQMKGEMTREQVQDKINQFKKRINYGYKILYTLLKISWRMFDKHYNELTQEQKDKVLQRYYDYY